MGGEPQPGGGSLSRQGGQRAAPVCPGGAHWAVPGHHPGQIPCQHLTFPLGPPLASCSTSAPPRALPQAYQGWTCLSRWTGKRVQPETDRSSQQPWVETGNYPKAGVAGEKHGVGAEAEGLGASSDAGTAPGLGPTSAGHWCCSSHRNPGGPFQSHRAAPPGGTQDGPTRASRRVDVCGGPRGQAGVCRFGAAAALGIEPSCRSRLLGTRLGPRELPQASNAACEELQMAVSRGAPRESSGKALASPRPHRSLLSAGPSHLGLPPCDPAHRLFKLTWHRDTESQGDGTPWSSRSHASRDAFTSCLRGEGRGLGARPQCPEAATAVLSLAVHRREQIADGLTASS